ncbi:MAG: thermonuclease family protein [Isosphaeraceae bacterium]
MPLAIALALSLVASSFGLAMKGQEVRGRVVGISDGNTLTVLAAENHQIKVRLHAIDCPETGQDFGAKASKIAFGKDVATKVLDTDRNGRTVGDVVRKVSYRRYSSNS